MLMVCVGEAAGVVGTGGNECRKKVESGWAVGVQGEAGLGYCELRTRRGWRY
jgi:hypothetical protein